MKRNLVAVYFSPTRTSRTIALKTASVLSTRWNSSVAEVDLTRPDARAKEYAFAPEDLVIFAFPVYAGRVPQVLEGVLAKMKGNGAFVVPLCVYGNRAYEDALLEARNLLTADGFSVIAAGAFIGEHSLSVKLAAGRPDSSDLQIASEFAEQIARKIEAGDFSTPVVKGNVPYRERMPAGDPVRPVTSGDCTGCGLCVKICPMGIIDPADPKIVGEGCLYCSACVKRCPVHAKRFEDPRILALRERLETSFMDRKEPELFV